MGFIRRSQTYYAPDKDPDSLLDYTIDWSSWLGEDDTVVDSTWIVPAGITNVASSFTTTTTTIWLSGGTLASTYSVTNRITTDVGRIQDQSFSILIKEL